ncbi:MAG TPA: hypothetical protein VGV88_08915 [Candidatus Dormibacteraeota bacterium]|nr:hypothetical protein [Candidatus Dormibacteraeota bacterium]
MRASWGRTVWRRVEPWLAQLVWLDPAAAAACISPEPASPPVLRVHRLGPSRSVIARREEHSVA